MAEITIRISDRLLKVMGALLLGIAGVWLVSYPLSDFLRPKYRLRMYTNEVAGLAVKAPVRIDGVEAGRVERLSLGKDPNNPDAKIEVILSLEKRYLNQLPQDSTATLSTEGLLGSRYVAIHRGLGDVPLPDNAQITAIPAIEKSVDLKTSLTRFTDCMKEAYAPQQETKVTPKNSTKSSQ